jgi:hypothetical protein
MAEQVETMVQLREVLQDEDLRRQLQAARDEQEVSRLLNGAGERQGYTFGETWIRDLLVDVKSTRWPPTFTEQELLILASRSMVADTAPKLCHTDSCGGGHGGCC